MPSRLAPAIRRWVRSAPVEVASSASVGDCASAGGNASAIVSPSAANVPPRAKRTEMGMAGLRVGLARDGSALRERCVTIILLTVCVNVLRCGLGQDFGPIFAQLRPTQLATFRLSYRSSMTGPEDPVRYRRQPGLIPNRAGNRRIADASTGSILVKSSCRDPARAA